MTRVCPAHSGFSNLTLPAFASNNAGLLKVKTKSNFMRKLISILTMAGLALAMHAQETNLVKTEIENFEARTNTVIIKGFGQIGSASFGVGTVSIRSKETIDASTGSKAYGIMLELEGQNIPRQQAILDEFELEPLANGLEYLAKITSDVSALPSFTAEFKTRSGLQFIAHSGRRQSSIAYFIKFDQNPRVSLNTDEIVQLKSMVGQAVNALNDLKRSR